jgi:hypothetical protein
MQPDRSAPAPSPGDHGGESPPPPLIDGDRAIAAIRDRWWLLVLVPAVAIIAALLWSRFEPYQTTVEATVLLPGDTEEPGSSERPELMILDDLPALVRSHAFADGVREQMPRTPLTVDEVQESLDGSRYSRILTVTISNDAPENVTAIAAAVELALPELINTYLIPEDGESATVHVINPPGEPARRNDNQRLQLLLVALSGVVAGTLIATLAGPRNPVGTQDAGAVSA